MLYELVLSVVFDFAEGALIRPIEDKVRRSKQVEFDERKNRYNYKIFRGSICKCTLDIPSPSATRKNNAQLLTYHFCAVSHGLGNYR